MSWETEIAKMFKQRNNTAPIGAEIGNVISVEPLRVSILGDKVILTSEEAYICSSLLLNYMRLSDIEINGSVSEAKITYKEILKPGDKVLCLPSNNFQTFFIIDKVVI